MAQQIINRKKEDDIKNQFMATLELGMPSKKCKNFGICRISPMGESNPFESQKCSECKSKCHVEGIVSVLEDDRVEVCFLINTINNNDFDKHFGSGYFLVEEDYMYSEEKFQHSSFLIKKGVYPIHYSITMLKIIFK